MIPIKTKEQIELQRISALMVGDTLATVAMMIAPGVTLHELNEKAEVYISEQNAVPTFKGYGGFTGALCLSPNEQVVHGLPSDYALQDGDIISIDCGVYKNGFHGDSAYTFAIGEVSEDKILLLQRTKESLYKGIEQARVGNRIGDIGAAIQQSTEGKYGYGVVKELVGHGVGEELHEEPQIPNYGKRGRGKKLQPGMVIAIEPMINMGTRKITFHADGWTVTTQDDLISAHYEHTVAIAPEGPDILSSFEKIEQAEIDNPNLTPIKIVEK